MKKIYKYHYNLYVLFTLFEYEPFYVTEAILKLSEHSVVITGIRRTQPFYTLCNKGFIKYKEHSGGKKYYELSPKGIAYIKYIEENKHLLTKFLLRN